MKTRASEIRGGLAALAALQALNYAIPLALLPFLTRHLGVEAFGAFAYFFALAQFAAVITDYGFTLSGTARVAKLKGRTNKLESYFTAVMASKLLLALATAFAVALFAILQEQYPWPLIFFTAISIFAQALQSNWFLQGLGKFRMMALLTALSRIVYLGVVLLVVRTSEDVGLAMGGNAAGLILSAVLGLLVYRSTGFKLRRIRWRVVVAAVRASSEYFASRVGVAAYNSLNLIFLGTFSTPVAVALYAAADQVYKAGQAAVNPVSQVIYPYMVRRPTKRLIFQSLGLVSVISLGAWAGSAALGREIVVILFGPEFVMSTNVLAILMVALIAYAPSTVLGYPLLGALGLASRANWSVICAGVVQLVVLGIIAITGVVTPIAVAGGVLLTELFLLAYRAHFARAVIHKAS